MLSMDEKYIHLYNGKVGFQRHFRERFAWFVFCYRQCVLIDQLLMKHLVISQFGSWLPITVLMLECSGNFGSRMLALHFRYRSLKILPNPSSYLTLCFLVHKNVNSFCLFVCSFLLLRVVLFCFPSSHKGLRSWNSEPKQMFPSALGHF